jgi:hypothetical protein
MQTMRTWAKTLAILFAAMAASKSQASAAQGNVNFWGNIPAGRPCLISTLVPGQLGTSPNGRQLSSKIGGGIPGYAVLFAWNPYEITVEGPSFFMAMPPNGSNGVTFTTTYSAEIMAGYTLSRVALIEERPAGQSLQLSHVPSMTIVKIDVVADRPDAFPGGNYRAMVTVRCE